MITTTFRFIGPIPTFILMAILGVAFLMCLSVAGEVMQTTPPPIALHAPELVIHNLASQLYGVETDISHAGSKHGEIAIEQIRKCIADDGVYQLWRNPGTDHWIELCIMDRQHLDTFGVRISGHIRGVFKELTGWIENQTCISKMEEYLIRQGYTLIH